MLYEIVNMSDPYTIEAHSLDVAATACLFLGHGQYAFHPLEQDSIKIPLFLLGGADDWFQQHFQRTPQQVVDDVVANKSAELADCFDSCLIGELDDRKIAEMTLKLIDDPQKQAEWKLQYLDVRRTSLNDIGYRAYSMAAKLRAKCVTFAVPAPQQVFRAF